MSSRKKKSKNAAAAPRARSSHGRQRQRLIEACISALHIYGPSRTTVEKVVAIAKMSPGIVRFYFDSKATMLVASLQFLAAEFEERVLAPVAARKSTPIAALEMMVDLYLDPDIASPRKVSVWYAFWGEASSRQEYYDICGQKDESFAALVLELIERTIAETGQSQLDANGVALGFIGALEILWQDFAFRTEATIDRATAKKRCMAYLRSVFPGQFGVEAASPSAAGAMRFAGWTYDNARIHALERSRLFQGAWVVVGHETQVPHAGDFFTVDIGAERVLVVRDSHGVVHALRNSCTESPHALVTGRNGRFDAVMECKLHGAVFSLDGCSHGDGENADLQAFESRTIAGLMFVRSPGRAVSAQSIAIPDAWLDARGPEDGGTERPPLPDWIMLDPPREIDVAADWKAVVEQWLEFAAPPLDAAAVDGSFGWPVPRPSEASWSGGVYGRVVDGVSPGDWRRRFMAPNQLIETRPDGLSVIQVFPVGPGRSRVRRSDYTALSPEEGARAALYLAQRLGPYARRTLLAVAESIQRAVTELGYEVNTQRRAAGAGGAVASFRRYLAARIPALLSPRSPTAV